MAMTDFDPNWEHGHEIIGVNGEMSPCRVICTDAPGDYPVIALYDFGGGFADIIRAKADGSVYGHAVRLINAPAPKRKGIAEAWINVYPSCSVSYETRDAADAYSQKGRIACLHVREEVEEGTGLNNAPLNQAVAELRSNPDIKWDEQPEPEEPKTVKVDCWLNVYDKVVTHEHDKCHAHASRAYADEHAGPSRIACIHIERDVTVGEGIDD